MSWLDETIPLWQAIVITVVVGIAYGFLSSLFKDLWKEYCLWRMRRDIDRTAPIANPDVRQQYAEFLTGMVKGKKRKGRAVLHNLRLFRRRQAARNFRSTGDDDE